MEVLRLCGSGSHLEGGCQNGDTLNSLLRAGFQKSVATGLPASGGARGNTLKLGLGTYAYAWAIGVPGYPAPSRPMDALAFVRQAASLGLNLAQIADNIALHTLPNLDALLDETRRLGVAIEVGTRGIAHDHLRTYLDIAREFGSPILRVVVDANDHHPAPEEVVETLRAITPEFERANVTLAIENHDRFKAHTLAKIIRDIGSRNVGICLDTVNSFGALEGPDVVVSTLGPYVVNLHVKEFIVRRADHNLGFIVEGCPAGPGMLDVPWLVDSLRNFGRAFNAIIELWPAPEATIEDTIRKENEWVAASVAYLRRVIPDDGVLRSPGIPRMRGRSSARGG